MYKLILVSLLLVVLAACSSQEADEDVISYIKISPEEAKEMMTEDTIILDVRTQQEYAEGHIEGATLLPVDMIGSEADSMLTDKDQRILVYCRSGNRSKTASKALIDLGYTNVYDFGGVNTWIEPLVK